jgi:acyl-CoA synthetase (AMP-forming)/AMP-acid ligase II
MITSSPERIEQYTRLGWWGNTTLHDLLWKHTASHPDRLAVADQPNRESFTDGPALRLTYADLNAASGNLACQLLDRGVGAGDIMIVQLPNIADLVVVYCAASMVGAIISPVPVQYGPHELGKACETLSPVAMIATGHMKNQPMAEMARNTMPESVKVLVFGDCGVPGVTPLQLDTEFRQENEDRIKKHLASSSIDANSIVTICWTSGTTGTPKGVPRSHNMWLATGRTSSEAGDYRADDRLLNPFPLVNMGALGGFFYPMMLYGCSLYLHHPFDPQMFLQQMQNEKITFTIVPPAVLNQLAKAEDMWNQFDFSALRSVGSGSAPLAPWMIKIFGERYGKEVINFYGSNEGISLFSTPETATEPEVRATMFPRMGCAGMPWKSITHETVRTRVVKVDSEEEITEPGQPGELLFDGATVFDGYLGMGNEEVFTSDGWFRTGDLVEICGEPPNYYRIVGRCKDIINRGGMKISPTEIDILLEGFAGLADGAVCAYPDERLGERVCACVVPQAGSEAPSLEQINAYLLERGLAKFKLPEKLMLVDVLPRNPMNKVLRNELEEMVKKNG